MPAAMACGLHHFDIELVRCFEALRFQQFVVGVQLFQPNLQLLFYFRDRLHQRRARRYIVAVRIDRDVA